MAAKKQIGQIAREDFSKHPICKSMNDPWKDTNMLKDPNKAVWVNPHNQFCFNSMWCSPEVLLLWMEGTGPMVKGKTPEEKKKYWEYAIFEGTPDPWGFDHSKYLIKYRWKWFDKIVSDFNPHEHGGYGINMHHKNPLKLKPNRTKDEEQNIKNTEEVIIAMIAPYVDFILKDLEYRDWGNIRKEVENDFYGIKRTLYCLGYGYMGACNTPEEISNLNWVLDIVEGKAMYLWMKKQNYELIPDFEFLTHPDRDKFDWDE